MKKFAYQITNNSKNWSGYFIWLNKETAESVLKEMNESVKNKFGEEYYKLKTVEIVAE